MDGIAWAEKAKDLSILDHIAIQAMVGLLSGDKLRPYTTAEQQKLSELSYGIAWQMCKEGGFEHE